MTTVVDAEVEELTGVDLEGALPCQCLSLYVWEFRKKAAFMRGEKLGHPCKAPSVARLRVACHGCGARYHLFLCQWHVGSFKRGRRVSCRVCHREGLCRGTES
jgi:hypothetical protein